MHNRLKESITRSLIAITEATQKMELQFGISETTPYTSDIFSHLGIIRQELKEYLEG